MRLEGVYRVGVLLCFLALAACDRSGPNSAGNNLPPASYRIDTFAFNSDGLSQTIRAASVKPAFFQASKAQPLVGRLFVTEGDQYGGRDAVVLCNPFWQQKYRADPSGIGKTLLLNGRNFTIVGVMPSTFEVP